MGETNRADKARTQDLTQATHIDYSSISGLIVACSYAALARFQAPMAGRPIVLPPSADAHMVEISIIIVPTRAAIIGCMVVWLIWLRWHVDQ